MIRQAIPTDAAQIAALLEESFNEFKSLYTQGGYEATVLSHEKVVERMKAGITWVFIRELNVIGTLSGKIKSDQFYLSGMAVAPKSRGSKIGWHLLKTAEQYSKDANINRMVLSTTPFLSSAIVLYEKFGFEKILEPPGHLLGTPLFRMEKSIPEKQL